MNFVLYIESVIFLRREDKIRFELNARKSWNNKKAKKFINKLRN